MDAKGHEDVQLRDPSLTVRDGMSDAHQNGVATAVSHFDFDSDPLDSGFQLSLPVTVLFADTNVKIQVLEKKCLERRGAFSWPCIIITQTVPPM